MKLGLVARLVLGSNPTENISCLESAIREAMLMKSTIAIFSLQLVSRNYDRKSKIKALSCNPIHSNFKTDNVEAMLHLTVVLWPIFYLNNLLPFLEAQ